MTAVTVDLPETHYISCGKPVFTSILFKVAADPGSERVEVWLRDGALYLDVDEARSLAAALLAAADASEVQG